jgi:SpoVK/Ycf46/Vps4 family AAA+-type ATPase
MELLNYFSGRYSISYADTSKLHGDLFEGMSGADIENLCREVAMNNIKLQNSF